MNYSDECKVELGMENAVVICRRPRKELTSSYLNPGRGVRVSLTIWAASPMKEGVLVVGGNINAQQYIEAIDNFVWPVIARHFPDNK